MDRARRCLPNVPRQATSARADFREPAAGRRSIGDRETRVFHAIDAAGKVRQEKPLGHLQWRRSNAQCCSEPARCGAAGMKMARVCGARCSGRARSSRGADIQRIALASTRSNQFFGAAGDELSVECSVSPRSHGRLSWRSESSRKSICRARHALPESAGTHVRPASVFAATPDPADTAATARGCDFCSPPAEPAARAA